MESTEAVVLEVLQRASSQNADILKPAESKLLEWETQPGFYTALHVSSREISGGRVLNNVGRLLQNVLSNHSIAVNVRWMAVLSIKNGVDKYWRKTAPL